MCCGLLPSRHSTLTDLVLFLNGIEVSVLIMLFCENILAVANLCLMFVFQSDLACKTKKIPVLN